MKRSISLALILGLLLLFVPSVLAEQGPDINCDTVRIPALGEKLETPLEIVSFEGFTFSLYGIDKTDEELIIYAHIKNETSATLDCTLKKMYYGAEGRMSQEFAEMPWKDRPEAGAEVDVAYHLPYPSFARDVSDDMIGFSFTVLPYIGSAPMCYANTDLRLGEPVPCELDFPYPGTPIIMYKQTTRVPLFRANGISIGIFESYNFDSLDLSLNHSGHDKPVKIAFENITVNAETVAETYEFVLSPESRMDEVSLPFTDVKTMTFDFAVYDAETGAQIFEKTKVILGGETEAQ